MGALLLLYYAFVLYQIENCDLNRLTFPLVYVNDVIRSILKSHKS